MQDNESAGHMEAVQPPPDNLEVKKTLVVLIKPRDITKRYSKLSELKRVVAFCKRFI
jgi:hypothetical protein